MKTRYYVLIGLFIIIMILLVLLAIFSYVFYPGYTADGDKDDDIDEENNTGDIKDAGGIKNPCVELGCEEGDTYVGSKNSNKYYECSCRYAKSINYENLVCFKNEEEALAENRIKSEC